MQLADDGISAATRADLSGRLLSTQPSALGADNVITSDTAMTLGMTGLVDILVFFGVLLVGFAYVWKRGDLDWIRAVTQHAERAAAHPGLKGAEPPVTSDRQTVA